RLRSVRRGRFFAAAALLMALIISMHALGSSRGSVIRGSVQPETNSTDIDPMLDAYLNRHGLTSLTIAHLQRRFTATTNDDERLTIAERLAELYVEQIEQAETDAEREKWGEAVDALLRRMPSGATVRLRLNLNIASYLQAERVAERWRLRAADSEEVARARQSLRLVSAEFRELIASLDRRIRRLEQRTFAGADDRQRDTREEQLSALDSMLSRARYYGAWSLYYKAWLPPDVRDDVSDAREALSYFAEILQSESDEPRLDELPTTLLEFEHVARSALGTALCYAEIDRPITAIDWLEALAAEDTHPVVNSQLPAYRIAIAFERSAETGADWALIEDQIAALDQEGTLSPTILRLVAVLSLEHAQISTDPGVRRIASIAIERLAALDRLAEVLEIAREFDLGTLDARAFTVEYVIALEAHQTARDVHGGEQPTGDRGEIALYEDAERLLTNLLSRPDASQYPEASGHARFLIAWSRYFRADYSEAADAFAAASVELERERAEQAGWMRIVSLDRLQREMPGDAEINGRLRDALQMYMKSFPWSNRAGRVQYRLAVMSGDRPTLEQVDQLLSVPSSSDAYVTARNEAERRLYRLFLAANASDDRVDLARRYLDTALPLLAADRQAVRSDARDLDATSRYVQRARRVLDVMLARGVSRIIDARNVLDALEAMAAADLISIEDLETELGYRRFQIDLRSGRSGEAATWAESTWTADPTSAYAVAAAMELYRYASDNWAAAPAGSDAEPMLDWTVTWGRRLVERAGDDPVLDDPSFVRLVLDVAEASLARHRAVGDARDREFARNWFARLLEVQPNHPPILRANAEFAEADGRVDEAIELWRTVLGRLPDTRPEWFEAKYHVARLLTETDRDRAIEVLRQHELLHPEFGPEPWGARMQDLYQRLIATQPSTETNDAEPAASDRAPGSDGENASSGG
ncbi:MAG: hypothetical protein ACOC0P_05770, partial [Planctomycetota bacterium]